MILLIQPASQVTTSGAPHAQIFSIFRFNIADDSRPTLEEALTIAPDDLQLQGRLAAAKENHRQAQLQALKGQARSHATAERWDEALTSWKAYLEK